MVALPIYLLFAAIPFWHLRLFGHISVYEIAVIVSLLFVPRYISKVTIRLKWLDALVYLFALYGILSVMIGSSTVYESMRVYRYMVLAPALLYLVVRLMQPNREQLAKSMVIFSSAVAVQALSVIYYVIINGERPVGETWAAYKYQGLVASIVTFSVLAVMAASAMLLLAWRSKGVKRLALLIIGLVCTLGLLASATRSSVFFFFLLFPMSGWFLRSLFRRKLLLVSGYFVLCGVMLSIIIISISGPFGALGGRSDNRREIERIVDVNNYMNDILGRLDFWGTLVRQGFSSPLFGKGMASFDIGNRGGTSFTVGSAHNTLVSAFYTSGLIGLVITLSLWCAVLSGLYKLNFEVPEERWRARFLVVSLMVMLLVSVTNDLTAGRGNLLMLLLALLNCQPTKGNKEPTEDITGSYAKHL